MKNENKYVGYVIDPIISESLNRLRMARFVAIFQAGEKGLILPQYKGSTFRGALGHAFRKVACTCSWDAKGLDINHLSDCIYQYLFETNYPDDSKIMKGSDGAPRPFVLVPPMEDKENYFPEDKLFVSFTLFGKGIDYLPYFISVLEQIGDQGLGKGHQKAELRQIFFGNIQGDFVPIYNSYKKELNLGFDVYNGLDVITGKGTSTSTSDTLSIYFQTPLRMKNKNSLMVVPEFSIILRGLNRRLASLLYVHHEQFLFEIDHTQFFKNAASIKLLSNETKWQDWERYSNRQGERMKLGGIIGKAVYQGDWQQYYPLLKLGEWIHLGKSSVFGLGKIKVIPN